MATDNIPAPPFIGPQPTQPIPTVGPGVGTFVVFTYELEKGGWRQYGASYMAWDALPLGYYRTQANFPDIPMFVYVGSRRSPDGEWLSAVFAPQDSPTVQGEDCPDGYGDVPVSELNIAGGPYGALEHWLNPIVGLNLAQLCAVLAVEKIPTCPEGFTWDPATETCKANPILPPPPPPLCPPGYHFDLVQAKCVLDQPDQPPPPPTCPPGYTWDPVTETCQPNTPPSTPTPCPPFTQLPDCLPTPPGSDPDNDEVGDLASQLAYWIEIQAIYLMNLFEVIKKFQPGVGNGTPGNPDPVTCAQLTAQVTRITDALNTIASIIPLISLGGGSPIDLTPVTDKLQAIADAIAKQGTSAPVDLKPVVDAINAEPDGLAKAKATIQFLVDQAGLDPAVGQILTS